ncbi:cold shock domain-containing protein [Paracoccus onubensis]|uniref:AAA family ATPase n=1 Tax=Paracoccus onubensis TaxID=1675788 RepID=UPI002731DC0A|nr:AAA family ATPase [Paracoccus onubensis]MDP0926582.1 cold shock domain-containing protein [Paracoccus onubensis]
MTSVDEAYEKILVIRDEVKGNIDNILTEEDAKIQIITRVITECLGWSFADIEAERAHENGYSDYLVTVSGLNALIVEAKRIGRIDIRVADKAVQKNLKLNGPALSETSEGVSQAASYAQPNGVPVAVLTDGNAWIVFRPTISGENYLNKQAFVFPSLDAVLAKFATFYDLLARVSFAKKTYNLMFDELHNARVLLANPLIAAMGQAEISRQQKSRLAFDLEPVFDSFFSRMTGEDDENLIIDCFVETAESRIADHSLEKMTARVLGNLAASSTSVEEELSKYLSNAVELDAGESVFIVGPTGSGKSTFVERFFKRTLAEETRSKCIPVRLNFLEASGSIEPTLSWTTESLIQYFETALYENGHPSWDELRGLYFTDYKRQSEGVHAKLYSRDKATFQEKFSDFMAERVEKDREGYLKRLLSDIVHNRKKLPVIVVDNTDEFPPETKEAVFQYIQSLRVHSKHCILIFPITDKSAWSFNKSDIYSIYQSKSFFLPTPPPREVFRRRIEYLKDKVSTADHGETGRRYLTDRNISVSIKDLDGFADVLEDAFVGDVYAAKILGELSNYNIRRTLRLARRVITSPVFQIEDLIVAFASGTATFNRHAKFMNALLKGDYNFFNQNDDDASEIMPIFSVDRKFKQSPLLQLRILTLLESTFNGARNVEERHISVGSISDYFQGIGCTEASIDVAVGRLINSNLVEPFDPSNRELVNSQRLAINYSGRIHLRLAMNNQVFFEQMALTTEIADSDVARMITAAHHSKQPIFEKFASIRTLFAEYLLDLDEREISMPPEGVAYELQRQLTESIRGFLTATTVTTNSGGKQIEYPNNLAGEVTATHTGVLGTVDFFDSQRGFGFVDVPEIGERCFLRLDVVSSSGIDTLRDGDDILCDVGPSAKGPQITSIHDVQIKPEEVNFVDCTVVRLVPDRYYGFVSIFGRKEDALFHFSLLSEEQIGQLEVGSRFKAEVRTNSKNGRQQVRKIEQFPASERRTGQS